MTYTFDIAYDCPIFDFLKLLDDYNLKLEHYIAEGPGGGNPEITVSGSPESIEKLQKII
jgi:hypothetical protein